MRESDPPRRLLPAGPLSGRCCLQGSVTAGSFQANGSAPEPALGLNQGQYGVRLTGQDVERGTFNQRHAALFDQVTGERCYSAHCGTHCCTRTSSQLD